MRKIASLALGLWLSAMPALQAHAAGAAFTNPLTGQPHMFVAGNYTDLGIGAGDQMPSDQAGLENNARPDLDRLRSLGVSNVRIWAHLGYAMNNYGAMANRVSWLAEMARQRNMTLTVDLFDSSGNNTLQNLRNNEAHINNMINYVIGANANKSHIYWSLGNEIGEPNTPLDFAAFYEGKVAMMRNKGAVKISFQPVPGSLNHRWGGDTTSAATRVINVSDDVSVHFYANGALANENNSNGLEFGSTRQWMDLASNLCKPAVIGEFGITDLNQRTDDNIRTWLAYFRDTLKVDQVSFWQFTKDEGGHTDEQCFCNFAPPGNGSHTGAMAGFLGAPPTYPAGTCGPQPPTGGGIAFQLGSPLYIQASNGLYLSSENGQQYIYANRSVRDVWEVFTVHANSDGTHSVKGNNGLWLRHHKLDGNQMKFSSGDPACWGCKFRFERIGSSDVYGVKSDITSRYMSSENGQHPVHADRSNLDIWEKWTIRNLSTPNDPWRTVATGGVGLPIDQNLCSSNNVYCLKMQSDGNLVLYGANGSVRWHAGTWGNPGSSGVMQYDGNLVIYRPNGTALWHTYTYGNNGAELQVSNDGFVRVSRNGNALWQKP